MKKHEVKALMFDFGPLHQQRYIIEQKLKNVLQTGDILYRASNAKGPLGIPFSQLVAKITKSDYSHAATVLIKDGELFVLEINDQGTLLYRFIDWLDTCFTNKFAVYRLKDTNEEVIRQLEKQIQKVLEDDPDYDFTFSDPDKFYCTESVATIYQRIGITLVEGTKIKDIVSIPVYIMLQVGSWLSYLVSKEVSLPFNENLYFVGNERQGLMSSVLTKEIYVNK